MKPGRPLFTVFTPTFNRAHTLPRVYDSLCAQTLRDFEWLVVDDGSHDETGQLVQRWQAESRVPIRYHWQPNAGKHRAFNRGVQQAQGQLFVPLDSDDACTPDALEQFAAHWHAIPAEQRARYAGITCLCRTQAGEVIGGPLPEAVVDGPFYKVLLEMRRRGEMWGFHRTEVLRQFPFPDIEGERFVPEGLVWNRISTRYLTRFVNVALRIYFDSADSISRSMTRTRHASPVGTARYYQELLQLDLPLKARLYATANVWRFGAPHRQAEVLRAAWRAAPLALPLTMPLGAALVLRDMLLLGGTLRRHRSR